MDKFAISAGVAILTFTTIASCLSYEHTRKYKQLAKDVDYYSTQLELKTRQFDNYKTQTAADKLLLGNIFNRKMANYSIATINVTISAYTASTDECNDNPHQTADMTPSRIGLLAVSRDLYNEIGLTKGQLVILPPFGVFRIHDTMSTHKRKNTLNPIPINRSVDILHATKKAAKLFGVKHDMKLIYIL